MSSKRSGRGFTLVEMIIAIVVIGVGLTGVLAAFNVNVRGSADPLIRKQMLAIAEEMLEEILLKPYAPGPGTISGCNRAAADDVADYNGYASTGICDIDGNPVAGLAGYGVGVSIGAGPLTDGATSVPAQRIVVTVSHGGESLTLVGWRTNHGS
ncbi:MAG: prepilin-type N-terminal cleavage/methylation domain-containing protein [Rhodocyclaceae bacterium]